MSFEASTAKLNQHFFFREFTFSKTTFRPTPEEEVELADSILWLDDLLVVFQLKERSIPGSSAADREERWFNQKVVALGTRQIRDTLTYLSAHKRIELKNHQGHTFELNNSKIKSMHKIVCYLADDSLPYECHSKKFHRSKTAGIIHLIGAQDYKIIAHTLLTPPELSEYLAFREELIEKWGISVNSVPEPALLGQYLVGDADSSPSIAFVEYLSALDHRADEWDISGIIKNFPDRVTTDNEPTDYYEIIIQIAKLKRNELREFKKRFQLSMEKSHSDELVLPYRFASPRTGCGFVFIPLAADMVAHRRRGIENLTYAGKYDLKLDRCLGISFAAEEGGWYAIEWCYMEFPWQHDGDVEERLRCRNPFREVRTTNLGRYTYR